MKTRRSSHISEYANTDPLQEGVTHPKGKPIDGIIPREHGITAEALAERPPETNTDVVVLAPRIGFLVQDAATLLYEGLKDLRGKVSTGQTLTEQQWTRLFKISESVVKLSKEERETEKDIRKEMARQEADEPEMQAIDALKLRMIREGWTPPGEE